MDQEDNFYTLKGYSLLEHIQITSSMAVSYTHLDVYKRQIYYPPFFPANSMFFPFSLHCRAPVIVYFYFLK